MTRRNLSPTRRRTKSTRKGSGSSTDPACRSSHLSRGVRDRRAHGTLAERVAEARATLERGPVVIFAHLSPVTSVEALDLLVTAGLVTRETRDELDLAALGRGQYTMRRVTVYTLK